MNTRACSRGHLPIKSLPGVGQPTNGLARPSLPLYDDLDFDGHDHHDQKQEDEMVHHLYLLVERRRGHSRRRLNLSPRHHRA